MDENKWWGYRVPHLKEDSKPCSLRRMDYQNEAIKDNELALWVVHGFHHQENHKGLQPDNMSNKAC